MATLSNTLAPPTTYLSHEGRKPASADPFWHSTPRSTPSPLGPLKTTMPQVTPAQRNTKGPAMRRPQCTHMNMTRVYGHSACYNCGRVPGIGWLYACHQDREFAQTDDASNDPFPVVSNESSYFDMQACVAESLSMGASVIRGIRNHDYTFEQVDKLIEQKRHLLATIRRTENGSVDSTPQAQQSGGRSSRFSENVIASVGTTAITATGAMINTPPDCISDTPVKRGVKAKTCSFTVCHTCRPFFQDRLYMSFEQMLSGRMPAVTPEEITRLPFLDAAIVRTIGLRIQQPQLSSASHSFESMDVTTQQVDGYDEDTSDWTPTSATISESGSDHLDSIDPYPCPGAGHCPLWSRHAGCAYDSDFDDGLRALHHGFGPEPDLSRVTPENSLVRLHHVRGSVNDTPIGTSSSCSSISLPTSTTGPLTPLTPANMSFNDALGRRLGKRGKATSMLDVISSEKRHGGGYYRGIHSKDSSSSFGSEVEVVGGVALTEEAVGSGIPDIEMDD